MRKNYIGLITIIALGAIFSLQGIWLRNTYKLLETGFEDYLSSLLILSLEKETVLRIEDPIRKELENRRNGEIIEGANPKNDHYTNNRFFQDYLYKDNHPLPISLEKLDSLFREGLKDNYKDLNFTLFLSKSSGNIELDSIHKKANVSTFWGYKEIVQLRNIEPEYITLTITSPYKIIFGKMSLMLIGSLLLAIIVMYALMYQIRIISW
jgi:two-component system phosphate regulon sensor histidine kinase PhoR